MNNLTPHTISEKYIDRSFPRLSLTEQAELLGISRTSLYYTPLPVDPKTLDLMKPMTPLISRDLRFAKKPKKVRRSS